MRPTRYQLRQRGSSRLREAKNFRVINLTCGTCLYPVFSRFGESFAVCRGVFVWGVVVSLLRVAKHHGGEEKGF